MKTVLEQERKYLDAVGTMDPYGISGRLSRLEEELAELGRKGIDEELTREFETLLTEFDKLYADVEQNNNEDRIKKSHRRLGPQGFATGQQETGFAVENTH